MTPRWVTFSAAWAQTASEKIVTRMAILTLKRIRKIPGAAPEGLID
jgi:hypothetical protein